VFISKLKRLLRLPSCGGRFLFSITETTERGEAEEQQEVLSSLHMWIRYCEWTVGWTYSSPRIGVAVTLRPASLEQELVSHGKVEE
jgi:hypothetical protein